MINNNDNNDDYISNNDNKDMCSCAPSLACCRKHTSLTAASPPTFSDCHTQQSQKHLQIHLSKKYNHTIYMAYNYGRIQVRIQCILYTNTEMLMKRVYQKYLLIGSFEFVMIMCHTFRRLMIFFQKGIMGDLYTEYEKYAHNSCQLYWKAIIWRLYQTTLSTIHHFKIMCPIRLLQT